MDMAAVCWTTVPNTFKKYFGQQLRWRRTTIRDFFFTLRDIPRHARDINVMSLYVYVLTPVVILISIVHMLLLFLMTPTDWLSPDRLIFYLAYALVSIYMVKWFHSDQAVINPIKLVVYSTWWIANNLILAPLALMTLDADGWGNRDKKKIKGGI